MAKDYIQCARQIINAIGGRENVVSIYHCMTRLRIKVKEVYLVNLDELDYIEDVKGFYVADDEVHIIIGVGVVDKVYDACLMTSNVEPVVPDKRIKEKRQNLFMNISKGIGEIFIPVMPALIAAGIMTGLMTFIGQAFPQVSEQDWYNMLMLITKTVIQYLPVLLAVSAADKFGVDRYLACSLGLMLMHRDLFSSWSASEQFVVPFWSVLGIKIYQVSYEGRILPVIIAVWFMSKVNRFFKKKLPSFGEMFITPLLTLLVSAFCTFAFIGPVMKWIETITVRMASFVLDIPFGIGSALCAAFYPVSIVFGIHQMFTVLEARFIGEIGRNIWIRVASSANISICAACFAVVVKTKVKNIKTVGLPATISAAFGVTEPALFGINLHLHIPFICGMVGSACGGAVGAMLNVYATGYGVSAIPGIVLSIPCMWQYLVMLIVSAFVTFALTWIFWKDDYHEKVEEVEEIQKKEVIYIYSPSQGNTIEREHIPDATFKEGYLGEGIGVIPDSGDIIAPFDGRVVTITPTRHALILEGPMGVQMLIHIGIDTVERGGEDFEIFKTEGESFKRGEKLMHFDLVNLINGGCNITSAIFIMNHSDYSHLKMNQTGHTSFGEIMFEIEK